MPQTGFLLHPASALHDTGWNHPEHQGRLRALSSTVGKDLLTLHEAVVQVDCRDATEEDLLRVHTPRHVELVRTAVELAKDGDIRTLLTEDTPVSAASWDAAVGSAGAVITAAEQVSAGSLQNAFVATRPPGHHATASRSMGFCLFNNVAIGARHAQAAHGLARVAVVDFDVHHGNGTQHMFEADGDLFFASTHQFPFYPGSGAAGETGVGNIVNVELAAGAGGVEFRAAMSDRILPALREFAPDFLLISAGFDAHEADPLAALNFLEADFEWATAELAAVADECCAGRLVSTLEGGYDLAALGRSAAAHVRALMAA